MSLVLVTGAGGYIGTVLVPMLVEAGHKVRAVDRFFFGKNLLPQNPQVEIVQEDTRKLGREHLAGVDAIIDLAAVSNDPSGELFQDATWAINHQARSGLARLAKMVGVKRYVLPSSCSVYGFQEGDTVANEQSATNPLTTYAKANEAAEKDVLKLADSAFTVVVLRQATVYGLSPRMRFDLAINGMTYGAWKQRKLPLMRDGKQWRPFVHVRDTASAQIFMLTAPAEKVNGQIFNVGSADNVVQLGPLGDVVAKAIGPEVKIEWYGDTDIRSYRVGFDKIEQLGWKAKRTVQDGVQEIADALAAGKLDKTTETITLEWYKTLKMWQERIQEVTLYGGILDIQSEEKPAVASMRQGEK